MSNVTIDNIPLSEHKRFAEKTEALAHDPHFLLDSAHIASSLAQLTPSTPSFSLIQQLFSSEPTFLPWALFEPPLNYRKVEKKIFCRSFLSWLDHSETTVDELSERLQNAPQTINRGDQKLLQSLIDTLSHLHTLHRQAHLETVRHQKG